MDNKNSFYNYIKSYRKTKEIWPEGLILRAPMGMGMVSSFPGSPLPFLLGITEAASPAQDPGEALSFLCIELGSSPSTLPKHRSLSRGDIWAKCDLQGLESCI